MQSMTPRATNENDVEENTEGAIKDLWLCGSVGGSPGSGFVVICVVFPSLEVYLCAPSRATI